MDMQLEAERELKFDRTRIEQILLQIADAFEIRIVWDNNTAVLTTALAIAGGVVGGYAGGRHGAAVGAGIGGITGFGVSRVVSLRELWETVKEKLKELLYIVFNYLRRLGAADYVRAYEIFMGCMHSRRELVSTIVQVIAQKLSTEVLSNIMYQ